MPNATEQHVSSACQGYVSAMSTTLSPEVSVPTKWRSPVAPTPQPPARTSWVDTIVRARELSLLGVLAILVLGVSLAEPRFLNAQNLRDILLNVSIVALLAGVLFGMVALGIPAGFDRSRISASVGGALPAVAGIILIVGAGGGFKQTLIDAGVAQLIGAAAGVMLLALMLVATGESLARSNAFKNVVLGVANATAAVAFALLGHVHWDAAAPLAIGLFAGGRLGPATT